MSNERKSVFISYAHKDSLDFTRRLTYALAFYMDVFWDRRLEAGEFPTQLLAEIERCEHFLLILSPHSLASEWCQKELSHAEGLNKKITLARFLPNDGTDYSSLSDKYTYADFTESFDVGFRRCTQLMLGGPRSPWEAFAHAKTEEVLQALEAGLLPALIAKEIVEWMMVYRLWPLVDDYATMTNIVFRAVPSTPLGIHAVVDMFERQFQEKRDVLGKSILQQVSEIVRNSVTELTKLSDDEHSSSGAAATLVISQVQHVLYRHAMGFRKPVDGHAAQNYLRFEIGDKIRELINIHARRSRYLY